MQGKLISHLSTNFTTSTTSSRPSDSSLALTSQQSNDRSRSVNNESVYNESVYNESTYNTSVYNEPTRNASVYSESTRNASVYNESTYNTSVYNTPVYTASVSELHNPSISPSRTLSSHSTSSDVTPIMFIPTTTIPGTHLEQQQSLPNIPAHPTSSGGDSTIDHPHNSPRPSAPGIVSPGRPITNANEDQYGPLPEGWESGIDPLGLTYYVDRHTRSITRNRPSLNQAVDHHTRESEAKAAWDQRSRVMSPNGESASIQPPAISQLGPLPSGSEIRLTSKARMHNVDHDAKTTTRDDPQLPLSLNVETPQYLRDFRRKSTYVRSQLAMHTQPGNCQIKVQRNHIFEDSYIEILRQTPNNLKKRLMIKFEGEDGLEHGSLARFVSGQALVLDGPHTPIENSFSCSHMRFSTPFTVFSNIRHTESHTRHTRCRSVPHPVSTPSISIISSSSDAFWA